MTVKKLVVLLCIVGFAASAFAADPPFTPRWWQDGVYCSGTGDAVACYEYGEWHAPIVSGDLPDVGTWDCNYGNCTTNPTECDDIHAATNITVDGSTVTVTLENYYVDTNDKRAFFYVKGTGATEAPSAATVTAAIDAGGVDEPTVAVERHLEGNQAGNWYVWVEVLVEPQPDRVIMEFDLPAGAVMTDAWAGSCCSPVWIPAVSEWGLIVMLMLGLTAGTIMFRKFRTVPA